MKRRGDQNKHGFEAEFHAKFYHRIYLRLTLFCRFSNKKKTYWRIGKTPSKKYNVGKKKRNMEKKTSEAIQMFAVGTNYFPVKKVANSWR
jgi:hypothetical protein